MPLPPLRPWVGLIFLRNCHVDNIRTCLILEIKNAIWEIKRDKFWKSKVSFEKSNATNFGNQKCQNQKHYLRNQMTLFWKLNIYWKNQTGKFWKSKMHLRNQTRQTLEIKIVIREMKRDNKNQRIFPFNHRQDIKIIEDKKRIRHSKFYLWYSSNTVVMLFWNV